ncbi:MAG: DHA2 family efflux MFS transporter permease subunit [Marinosulfonomonas sp.]|nr:DHA2 family efflux MFS transporter permease subunit [Marinosulfonomonas sp.]
MSVTSEEISTAGRKLLILTVLAGSLSTVISGTVVNVVFPSLSESLGVDRHNLTWISVAFFAAMTSTMLSIGWAIDTFGIRRVFSRAMTLFIIGSVVCAMAQNLPMLILGRIAQGASAGAVQPLVMIALFRAFPASERGFAMGILGMGAVMGPTFGPMLGGVLIDTIGWRWLFVMTVPTSILCMITARYSLVNLPASRGKFDWKGVGFLVLTLVPFLIALAELGIVGALSPLFVVPAAVSVIGCVIFIRHLNRAKPPLLEPELFRSNGFGAFAVIATIFGAVHFGSLYLFPLFMQNEFGYSASRAGLVMVPGGIIMAILFPYFGKLSDRIPAAVSLIIGFGCFAISFVVLAVVPIAGSFWMLVLIFGFGRAGLGVAIPALGVGSIVRAPENLRSQAAASISFMRQMGGALGIGIMSVLLEVFAKGPQADHSAFVAVFVIFTCVCFAGILLVLTYVRRPNG